MNLIKKKEDVVIKVIKIKNSEKVNKYIKCIINNHYINK